MNQFEIPEHFYAGCLFGITHIVDGAIHLGENNARARFKVFLLGCICVFSILLATVWQVRL